MPFPLDDVRTPALTHRGFWVDVEHPELGRTFPSAEGPFVASATPWRFARRPPRLGEPDAEIYGALDLGEEDLKRLRRAVVIR